jgi:hypothetical protein
MVKPWSRARLVLGMETGEAALVLVEAEHLREVNSI